MLSRAFFICSVCILVDLDYLAGAIHIKNVGTDEPVDRLEATFLAAFLAAFLTAFDPLPLNAPSTYADA